MAVKLISKRLGDWNAFNEALDGNVFEWNIRILQKQETDFK